MGLFRKHVSPIDAILAMVADGEYRPPDTLALLDRMGLLNGMPDLLLFIAGRRTRLIEVKLETTLQHKRTFPSADQRDLHAELAALGHPVDVVRNFEEFWAIVEAEGIPHTLTQPPARQDSFSFRRQSRPRPRG